LAKADIRNLAYQLKLPNYNASSDACLASRIYGNALTLSNLRRIEEAEAVLVKETGVPNARVEDYGNLARIVLGKEGRAVLLNDYLVERIHASLKELGFKHVTIDLKEE
ncbi:MAG: TIGR00268 family protein, partial [Candidatus Micrarchaeota archaeon]